MSKLASDLETLRSYPRGALVERLLAALAAALIDINAPQPPLTLPPIRFRSYTRTQSSD